MSRPRDASIDTRVLAAARALAAEGGLEAVTVAAVAARAGVSRPALYRRWPTRAALLFEMQTNASVPAEFPDLGSFAAELRAAVEVLAGALAASDRHLTGDQFAAMIADRAFADRVWATRWGPDREIVLTLWRRALERGDVRPDVDAAEVIDGIVAACVFRVLLAHLPAEGEWLDRLVDRTVAGVGRRPSPRRASRPAQRSAEGSSTRA